MSDATDRYDVEWWPTVEEGLAEAARTGRPVLVHACGQGIGATLDDL